MIPLLPKDVPPTRLAYYALRLSSTLNHEGRPWSLLLTAYHVVMLNSLGITSFLGLILRSDDLTDFVQIISTFTIYIHNIVRCINLLTHQTEIIELIKRVDEIRLKILKDERTSYHIIEADKLAKKCIILFNSWFLTYPFLSLIINFIIDYQSDFSKPSLVLQVWLPWNSMIMWQYFVGTIFVCFNVFTALIYYTSYSTLQFAFTIEISAFIKTLQYHLEYGKLNQKGIYEQHQTIIRLIQDYNQLFSGQVYLEILVSSLQPCGFGYATIKLLKKYDPGSLHYLNKMFMCLAGPYIICTCGQIVKTQIERLHQYTYMNNWYEEKPSVRKDLLTMMILTLNPIVLNYRRMVCFDYICLAAVLQGVYSYMMLIINFDSD